MDNLTELYDMSYNYLYSFLRGNEESKLEESKSESKKERTTSENIRELLSELSKKISETQDTNAKKTLHALFSIFSIIGIFLDAKVPDKEILEKLIEQLEIINEFCIKAKQDYIYSKLYYEDKKRELENSKSEIDKIILDNYRSIYLINLAVYKESNKTCKFYNEFKDKINKMYNSLKEDGKRKSRTKKRKSKSKRRKSRTKKRKSKYLYK